MTALIPDAFDPDARATTEGRLAFGDASDSTRTDAESFVRLKGVPVTLGAALGGPIAWLDAEELLDELCDDQLRLSSSLLALERACLDAVRLECPTAHAALRSIDVLLAELRSARDGLAMVQMAALPSLVHPALLTDAPLAEYLRGVFAWMNAVVRAVADLVAGLVHREPAWSLYRWRIEEAQNFHFFELEAGIRADFDALEADGVDGVLVARLAASFNALLKQACQLEARLASGLG